jgi:hypothetical protein
LTTSAVSDLECCKDCLRVCAGCNAEVAPEELDETTNCCPNCLVAEPETGETNPVSSSPGDSS